MSFSSKQGFNKSSCNKILVKDHMLITEIDTYEVEEFRENYPPNRILDFQKAERQKLFEKWLSQT
jgi:hypothetical protein